ncbi:MerR family transcriptional regulator [Rubellimicrobium sp. CFH 75288]|uniref:MerR family transcriptional regulator n=1 Tax=Rubellimicrobium sp. CFH 75288 TaxID=2697034 RepID=UPI001411BD6B|nr:MerR family transcriptional regulator [Rubellimicrobium sp. CFH 75288]NAZ37046.1 MerR family transcriptional regulator [Rubellimicrobium sp. CFH 75288]
MSKSPDAFRTISEVAATLETPPHVLRFWESRFKEVRPVKRAGGRRYYRPEDVALLAGIKALLHEHHMSIAGVQKLLKEKGARHVALLSSLPWDAAAIPEDSPGDDQAAAVIVGPWPRARPGDAPSPDDPGQPEPCADRADTEGKDRAGTYDVARLHRALKAADADRLRCHAPRIAVLAARLREAISRSTGAVH